MGRKLLSFIGITMALVFSICIFSNHAYAADAGKSYTLTFNYYTTQKQSTAANVTLTMSTSKLQKGTVITLTGIPNGSFNNGGGYENVDIAQRDNKYNDIYEKSYGGESKTKIKDGKVTYTVQSASYPVMIWFGSWVGNGEGGMDAVFTINTDGTVVDMMLQPISPNAAAPADTSALANASVNNAEFNAKVYYDSNPDLQTAIGADAQALYNHWVQYGKAEGRKAK
jgi:hypothetical protein